MRDYALFLTYLATGRRNSEIRTLRYGDIESCPERSEGSLPSSLVLSECEGTRRGLRSEGRIWFRWNGKGRQRRDELPQSVWTAILDFLKSSDHRDSISPSDYLFIPLNQNARHLPNVNRLPSPARRGAGGEVHLSSQMVGRLLKKYIRLAGLNPQGITVHTLRHTAAMLRKEAGDDLQSISSFLAHSSLAVTQIYLHQVEGRQDTTWLKVEALLGINT